jgi:hypothetical protein
MFKNYKIYIDNSIKDKIKEEINILILKNKGVPIKNKKRG